MAANDVERSTPFPGTEVVDPEKASVLDAFNNRFAIPRGDAIPFNIPLACSIAGESAENFWEMAEFLQMGPLYLLVENYPQMLMTCSPEEVREFMRSKEPWEDHDLCILDESMSFCYAASHEERFTLVRLQH